MSSPSYTCVAAIVLFSISAVRLAAQIAGAGSIHGVVSDKSGAVIPSATVTATDLKRGVKTVRQVTGAGFYNISPLNPGDYSVTVTSPGFETLIQQHVIVDAAGWRVGAGSNGDGCTVGPQHQRRQHGPDHAQ